MAPLTRRMHRLSQIRKWSQLPQEILDLFLQKLPHQDCLNFGKVCTHWRSVFLGRRQCSRPPPCMFLRSTPGGSTLGRGIFHRGQLVRLLSPHPIFGTSQRIVGSCFGWLVIADYSDIYLLNPASNEGIPLPSLASFTIKHVDLSSIPGNGHCVLTAKLRDGWDYYLAWCSPGDEVWTIVNFPLFQRSLDSMFHNGKLYVLGDNGDIAACTIDLQPNITIQVSLYDLCNNNFVHLKRFVQSDEELFLVVRPIISPQLHVFRNKEEQGCSSWVRVDCLGNRVLLIGKHGAESLNTKKLMGSTYEPNCIYYYFAFDKSLQKYSMADRRTENICVVDHFQEWVLTKEW